MLMTHQDLHFGLKENEKLSIIP